MGHTRLTNMATKGTVTIRPRKLLTNRLLQRRQVILDVHHPGLATPDKEMLKNKISEFLSKNKGQKAVAEATVIFGMKTCFGGGKSTCFALCYDSVDAAKKHEPSHRLIRSGHKEAPALTIGRKRGRRRRTARRSSVEPGRRSASVLATINNP